MSMTKMDVNQIWKTVYSEEDQALKTIPSANTSFSIELDADDGDTVSTRSMSSDVLPMLVSEPIDMKNYRHAGIIVKSESMSSVVLEMSNDLVTWISVKSSESAMKHDLSKSDINCRYIRLVSSDVVEATCILKG